MRSLGIEGCYLTPLKVIKDGRGSVMHFVKSDESNAIKFGEVYFSTVDKNCVKGWKMHTQMTSNLVVPCGEIEFVIYDPRQQSASSGMLKSVILSVSEYYKLTICPGVWVAFQGRDSTNLIANFADMIHDPDEAKNLPLDSEAIPFNWSKQV